MTFERQVEFEWDENKADANLRKLDDFHSLSLVAAEFGDDSRPADFRPQSVLRRGSPVRGKSMSDRHIEDDDMPPEIDFSRGVRGLHHIGADAKVFLPASIERTVWEYFAGKAEQRGIALPELLTEVLRRNIEIHEALK